jgi:hypothetical protein
MLLVASDDPELYDREIVGGNADLFAPISLPVLKRSSKTP